jgi:hypothetical protein
VGARLAQQTLSPVFNDCSADPSHAAPRAQTHGQRHRRTTGIAATGITSTHFVLPFDSTFGPLKLETLWAPSALRGIERRADTRSSHRQRPAAPHADQPRGNPRPTRAYGRRTPPSLRDLINFQNLPSRTHFNPIHLARSGISMKVKEHPPSQCGSPKGGGVTLSSCCRQADYFQRRERTCPCSFELLRSA